MDAASEASGASEPTRSPTARDANSPPWSTTSSAPGWCGSGPEKGREAIDRFFAEALSEYQRAHIRWASCDMSRAYTEAIKHHCPDATLVIDHFHVTKALNEAVDAVRKEEWRALAGEQRKAIKGLRWLLYRHPATRTKGQTRTLNRLRHSNRRIHRAWVLKDQFAQFWGFTYKGAAEKFLRSWMTSALRSRIPSLRTFVGTLKTHFDNILAFVEHDLTNAVAEGLNRIIKIVKNRASGYRNLDAFTDMIYLVVGDFGIPAVGGDEKRRDSGGERRFFEAPPGAGGDIGVYGPTI